MKKAIVFDLDGTLLDTIADLHAAASYAIENAGYNKPTLASVHLAIGDGLYNLLDRLTNHELTKEELANCAKAFIAYYKVHLMDQTKPYPLISALLGVLKEQKLKLFVLSNKDDIAVKVLIEHFFPNTFTKVLGHKNDLPIKPDPRLMDILLEDEVTIAKEEILFIGDSKTDILTAHNYGVDCIIVPWGYGCNLEQYQGYHLISNIDEIIRLINQA